MKLIGSLVLAAVVALGQAPADVQLKAAAHKAEVEGDLKGAMEAYRRIIATNGKDRAVAAKAMLHLAQCHEKLGQAEARSLYEQIATNYRDQAAVAAEARERLAALDGGSRPSGGLTARQVWTGPDVDPEASITPDGRLMAMTHWETGDVGIRDLGTARVTRLNLKTSWQDSSDFAETPVFSPDQRQIAYAWLNTKDRNYEVRLSAVEPGAKPRVLVSNPELVYFQTAGWSRDGKSILAVIWGKDRTSQLAWISAGDGSVKVLKSLEWRQPQRIALSPDGRYVAYDVLEKQNQQDRDIYVLAVDGSSESAVAAGPTHHAGPSWTPDGSQVVFLSNRSGRMDLWSVAVRDGKPQGAPQVVKADIGSVDPIGFSRTGAFYYVHNRSDEDVFAVEMDPVTGKGRGAASRITQAFLGRNERPAWSPDGKWIAFLAGDTRAAELARSLWWSGRSRLARRRSFPRITNSDHGRSGSTAARRSWGRRGGRKALPFTGST